jgi:hypothetical protein
VARRKSCAFLCPPPPQKKIKNPKYDKYTVRGVDNDKLSIENLLLVNPRDHRAITQMETLYEKKIKTLENKIKSLESQLSNLNYNL